MNEKSVIAVLGDGGWGTALSILLNKNGHEVRLWGPFPDNIGKLRGEKENKAFLPGVPLPGKIILCEDIGDAVKDASLTVFASPSQYLRSTLEKYKEFHEDRRLLVNVAKGIENLTLKRMSEVCENVLGPCRYTVISGPSHAEEVSRAKPTAVVAASDDLEIASEVQRIFMNNSFRVYTTDDVTSVELGGSLKNVMAIASGVIDGMELGDNPKAAMITRGIAEMARLGIALGGRAETFSGLSGIGDMIVTCISRHSRNRHVGEALGRGKKIDEILSEMGLMVAEGVKTALTAYELAKKHAIETPIINQVYKVLYEGKAPSTALNDLMNRKARTEFD